MPLLKGKAAKSKKGISENIRREKEAHPSMDIKQAAAIAYSTARGNKKRAQWMVSKHNIFLSGGWG